MALFGRCRAAALLVLTALPLAAQSPDRVGFRAQVSPDTVYVGQQATYALTVQIPTDVRQRLRRNPEFVPPEPRAMLAYELPLARSSSASTEAEVHTFRRALFLLSPGRYTIAPARLSYAIPQSASFFSREEERTLRSDAVSLVAIDPPARGRPSSWLGAVGSWRASARVDASQPRVGDPVVLTLRLEGEGNPNLLPRPLLAIPWADVVSHDERVVLEAAPTILGGAKEFSWLVTPREPGARTIPPIEYTFFDPVARAYAVARSSAVPLQVRPGTVVAVPPRGGTARDSLPLGLRPALAGARSVGLPLAWLWFAVAALAPLPWALRRWWPRTRRAREARAAEPAGSARALLERGLRDRTGVDVAAHTSPGTLAAALRLEGVTPETARDAEALRDACDAAGFAVAGSRSGTATSMARAEALLKRVAEEARRRTPLLVLLLALAGCLRTPTASERAVSAFAEGRTAYVGGDYLRARNAFARAATTAPRDPNAWANLGTAAWQAADTAIAVLGWQRALRLDPRDDELRERLKRVRAPQLRGAGRIWPVPPLWVASIALACWLLGWGWAYRARRRGARSRLAAVLILPGMALAAVAWHLESRLAARDLVVVTQPTPLRALPALGADAGAVPLGGEVALVLERRGVWLRIQLDGQREGWYPTDRTQSLARD